VPQGLRTLWSKGWAPAFALGCLHIIAAAD
jgi:hypothetical protein